MFEKFTSVDSQDFQRRYQGTYGFFTHQGKKTLTRLDKINADGRASYVEFSDREGLKYLLKPDSETDGIGFEFLPPKCAYYNTKSGTPLLVSRVPARQYLRGICDRNTSISTLNNDFLPVEFENLVTIFEERATPAEALIPALKADLKNSGIAVSPQFAVGFKLGVIKCFNQAIGKAKYDTGLFTISLDNPSLWQQEVMDAFRRSNLNMVLQ